MRCDIMGPMSGDAQIVWTQWTPDGDVWFEHRVGAPGLEEEQGRSLDLFFSGTDAERAVHGDCRFTLQLVDELMGSAETLHEGSVTVTAVGVDVYHADFRWLQPLGLLTVDVHDDKDAPPLRVSTFVPGEVGEYDLAALLFHEGNLVNRVSGGRVNWAVQASDRNVLLSEVVVELDKVRAWNNLRESGWGSEFFTLDTHPGSYELRIAADRKVIRKIFFTVNADGVLETERIEPNVLAAPTAWFATEQTDGADPVDPAELESNAAYGGDLTNGALFWGTNGMYWFWAKLHAEDAQADPSVALLIVRAEEAESLLRTWESDMQNGVDTSSAQYLQEFYWEQCQKAVDEIETWLAGVAADGLPDDGAITVRDEETTLSSVSAALAAVRDRAVHNLELSRQRGDAEADRLDSFRNVLAADKLRIFQDRPIGDFEYVTSGRREITEPDELAAAEYWYFEGAANIAATATVDGSTIHGSVQGWRLRGFQFDEQHRLVDEFEESGTGGSAPISAYQRGR